MKRIIIFAISVMIGIGVAVIAQAQNFYVGGGSSQWQVMKNDGLITNIDLWQTQYQIQSTILGFEDTSLAEVDSFLCSCNIRRRNGFQQCIQRYKYCNTTIKNQGEAN